ncbi:hypothetical protein DPMN_118799 [Dreissena polymorpha]|uniref:Uncharacterized protein n=1 Tax=Dreissena polymorpha TaxID=45954 RepID=A0A9D4JM30_DREPO|nr:hypothetical protein DPMN_118799 [Dreissena polymorpha]
MVICDMLCKYPRHTIFVEQIIFLESHIFRWKKSEGSNSVLQSYNDPCIVLIQPGLNGTFSQITFKFSPSSLDLVGHSLYVISNVSGNETEIMITKMTLDKPQLTPNTYVFLLPSNINAFVRIGPGDKVCVSPSTPDMVYISAVNLHAELSFLALTYNSAKGSALHFVYKIDKTEQTHSTYI